MASRTWPRNPLPRLQSDALNLSSCPQKPNYASIEHDAEDGLTIKSPISASEPSSDGSSFHTDDSIVSDSCSDPESIKLESLSSTPRSSDSADSSANQSALDATSPISSLGISTLARKGRGRPRKFSANGMPFDTRVQKHTRTKTGCGTCRKRKKKCDEGKPTCQNCVRGLYECEGYAALKHVSGPLDRRVSSWRTNAAPPSNISQGPYWNPAPSLNCLFRTVVTPYDHKCFQHYCEAASLLLTSNQGSHPNPYQALVLPIALDSPELTHALLGVGGVHLSRMTENRALRAVALGHHDQALKALTASVKEASSQDADVSDAMTLVLVLQTCFLMIDGEAEGDHHVYINNNKYIKYRQDKVGRFAKEFVDYVSMGRELTSINILPVIASSYEIQVAENSNKLEPVFDLVWAPTTFDPYPYDGILTRVLCGLRCYIRRCVRLRRKIRARKARQETPWLTYPDLIEGQFISRDIIDWVPGMVTEDAYSTIAEIFRRVVLVHLYRTLTKFTSETLQEAVNQALDFLERLPKAHAANTLLVLPVFILGCSASDFRQRERVEIAFDRLRQYSHFGNIDASIKVVRKVWEYIDAKDGRCWDWEQIQREMGLDFPIA